MIFKFWFTIKTCTTELASRNMTTVSSSISTNINSVVVVVVVVQEEEEEEEGKEEMIMMRLLVNGLTDDLRALVMCGCQHIKQQNKFKTH